MNDFRALVLCNLAVLFLVGMFLPPDPTFGQSYAVTEEKRKLIGRLGERLCQIANENSFLRIKKILSNIGKRYIGEEITVEEAYPYIYCNEMMAANIDLIRLPVEYPLLDVFLVDFLYHFTENVSDKSYLGKIVSCKRDLGDGCLDVFEHIAKRRRSNLSNAVVARRYDFVKEVLWEALHGVGGAIRDPKFCREVLNEPRHCHTD